jgi:hypothetical protein
VTSQKTGILDYTAVKSSKLAHYTCMGRLLCDVSGDSETIFVGLEPLQMKATCTFETSGTTYDAASHASSVNLKESQGPCSSSELPVPW